MRDDFSQWLINGAPIRWIGLDIGGANLKAADGRGRSESMVFPLWQKPEELAAAIGALLDRFGGDPSTGIAMTMTGELADCYETKAHGVRAIVAATTEAARDRPVRVATTEDFWLLPEEAVAKPQSVAAANWRLAARLVALNRPTGRGLWIDIGSTTADVIPIKEGRVCPQGLTDPERLMNGELVYTGVRRTPICAVVDRLPYRGRTCPVAAEWFATTADAWVLLGELPEDAADEATADGRPLTRAYAIDRLARCLCADRDSFSADDAQAAAERIADAQTELVAEALPPGPIDWPMKWIVVGGEGEFLARRAVARRWDQIETRSISDLVGASASRCLPAHAAAFLAELELAEDGLGEPR